MRSEGGRRRSIVEWVGLIGAFFLSLSSGIYADSRFDMPVGSEAITVAVSQDVLPVKGDRVDLLWQAKTMVRGYVLIQNVLVVDSHKMPVQGESGAEATDSAITLALNERNQRLMELTEGNGKYTTLPHLGMVADQRKLHISLMEPRSGSEELKEGSFANVGWSATRLRQNVKMLAEGALVIGGPRPLQLLTTYKQKKAIEENKTLGEFHVEDNGSSAGLFKVASGQNRVQVSGNDGGNLDLVFDKKGNLVNRKAE